MGFGQASVLARLQDSIAQLNIDHDKKAAAWSSKNQSLGLQRGKTLELQRCDWVSFQHSLPWGTALAAVLITTLNIFT